MAILSSNKRPVVMFDAANIEHRKMYAEYRKTRSWNNAPVRFKLENMWSDIVSMIEDKMLKYYVNQEMNFILFKEATYAKC